MTADPRRKPMTEVPRSAAPGVLTDAPSSFYEAMVGARAVERRSWLPERMPVVDTTQPAGFTLLAPVLGGYSIWKVARLLTSAPPEGVFFGAVRVAGFVSVACCIALVFALWRRERWVTRAAAAWVASVAAVGGMIGVMEPALVLGWEYWLNIGIATLIPGSIALYVRSRARLIGKETP
jgi:hypothetical protein